MLFSYLMQVQRFLRDGNQDLVNPADLITLVNRARREIAMRTQSIRIMPPVSGSIMSATVTAGGSGYTAPVVTITPPDFPGGAARYPRGAQATATATVVGGQIVVVDITFGGYGYFQPQITITDPTGVGATAAPVLSYINQTIAGQEQYQFSAVDLTQFPGVGSIFAVKSVSLIFSSYRFSIPVYSFSTYQAQIRNYPYQYEYVPTVGAQVGQGVNGSLYLYPLASQAYQMEWDCFCLPDDLLADQDYEALPPPWTEAVPYFATHLAYLELQNLNAAKYYEDQFEKRVHGYSAYARPGRATNISGRW